MKGRGKWSLLLALAFVLSVFLSACSGGGGGNTTEGNGGGGSDTAKSGDTGQTKQLADKQILHLGSSDDLPGLDSSVETDVLSHRVLAMVHSGLMTRYNNKLKPDMAAGMPKVNDDKTVYTFTIRDDAKWSNGDPVTAQDFVYAWHRAVNPKTASPYAYIFGAAHIKNAAKIMDKESPLYGKVDKLGVKALGKKKLQVTLEKPVPYFVGMLNFVTFYPLHKETVKKYGKKYATEANKMLFNGAYTLASWDHGTGWTLKKNPKYWDAKNITLNEVDVKVVKEQSTQQKLYKAGKLDLDKLSVSDYVTQYKGKPELKQSLGNCVYDLKPNVSGVKAFGNVKVRQAMSLSINRKGIANSLMNDGSIPAHWWVPYKNMYGPKGNDFISSKTPDNPTYFKPDKAKKLWKEAKKELGIDSVNVTMLTINTPPTPKRAQFVAHELESTLPGMHINIKKTTWGNYLELSRKGKYGLAFGSGWCPDYKDPMTFLDMWLPGNPNNSGKFNNEQYNKLIHKAQSLGDQPEKRWKVLQQAHKLLMHQLPIIPTTQAGESWVVQDWIKGVNFPAYGPEIGYRHAKIYKH